MHVMVGQLYLIVIVIALVARNVIVASVRPGQLNESGSAWSCAAAVT